MSRHSGLRSTNLVLIVGLALTIAATAAPFATTSVLESHIQDGYPDYGRSELDSAVAAYLVMLTIVGVLGAIGWLAVLWGLRAGKRWVRLIAIGLFLAGLAIALTGLLVRDTSGDTGLPPTVGWLGVLPVLAGGAAVVMLWKRPVGNQRPAPSPINH